jgi:EAL domain-containing protein (putative c-di-GMP-specific phosphodiesterase class I)
VTSASESTSSSRRELFEILEGVGDRVVVELTEHDPVDDYGALKAAVHSLRGLGALIAVDDAGTGFSTFERILRLEPDIVKVDLRVARDVVGDPTRRALVAALNFFASSISATIVAEGIETPSELELVRRLKMAYGQGSWLGVPGPFPSVSELSVRR